jgi:hypothetical protein
MRRAALGYYNPNNPYGEKPPDQDPNIPSPTLPPETKGAIGRAFGITVLVCAIIGSVIAGYYYGASGIVGGCFAGAGLGLVVGAVVAFFVGVSRG